MIKLILVRHAITTCNEGGNLSGLTDSMLSEKGKLQVKNLTNYLKDEKIDEIYSTPFSRTKETIRKLAEIKNIDIVETDELNEINFGDFEGLGFEFIQREYPEEFEKMINEGFDYKYPQGESLKDTFYRVAKKLDNIMKDKDSKTILICSHGGTIRNIISYLLTNDYKYHWNFKIDNSSVSIIEIDNKFAVINKLNDTSFLI
ncbi:histidine phosphatase family protein [Terrisporobacter mayombei]|nr:histidine phosphatase family protein [Terrisporobacter mayombei]